MWSQFFGIGRLGRGQDPLRERRPDGTAYASQGRRSGGYNGGYLYCLIALTGVR